MLVLSRRCHEAVVVAADDCDAVSSVPSLTITVLAISNGKVKLGFDGAGIVHRLEVWQRLRGAAALMPAEHVLAPEPSNGQRKPRRQRSMGRPHQTNLATF